MGMHWCKPNISNPSDNEHSAFFASLDVHPLDKHLKPVRDLYADKYPALTQGQLEDSSFWTNAQDSTGKSCTTFYTSICGNFFLKSCNKEDEKGLTPTFLKALAVHLREPSLCQIIFKIFQKLNEKGESVSYIVINKWSQECDLYGSDNENWTTSMRIDFKGSLTNRQEPFDKRDDYKCVNLFALWDKFKIYENSIMKHATIHKCITNARKFLEDHNRTDYSLLIGVKVLPNDFVFPENDEGHPNSREPSNPINKMDTTDNKIYGFACLDGMEATAKVEVVIWGVIDILQTYTKKKHAEAILKADLLRFTCVSATSAQNHSKRLEMALSLIGLGTTAVQRNLQRSTAMERMSSFDSNALKSLPMALQVTGTKYARNVLKTIHKARSNDDFTKYTFQKQRFGWPYKSSTHESKYALNPVYSDITSLRA